jgi:putative ABC transport system permease protein
MALFVPLLFLGVGALVMASILGRMVDAQRPLIGTLLALGVPRSRVLGHYLAFAVALGLLGAGLGVALAEVGSGELTRSYAEELAIPFVSTRFHPGLDLGGVLLAAGVAALAGFLPARRAAGLSPVEAMRPGAPRNGWATGRLFRPLARLPLPARLAARGVLATPLRSLTSAGGVTAAVVLLLTTTAITDGMTRAVDVQFHQEERYDLRAEWNEPRPAAPLRSQVGAAAPGSTIEVGLAVPATLRRSTRSAKALVEAVEPHATLLKTLDENGRSPTLGPGEVALPHSAAHALDCRPGDVLTLDLEPWARPVTVRVGFIRDGVMGSTLNARLEDLRTWLGAPGAANFAVLATPSERREATRLVLFTLPGVARVHDAAAMRGQLDLLMGLSYAMVGAMALFGAILAAAIVFNTSTLSILERSREFATLRALGLPMRKIRAQVTLGNGALALLGAALGLPLAVWTARAAAASLDSDLFSVTAYLSPRAMLLALLEIAAVLLLGQWPALRTIARANLAEAVRSREG